MGALCPKPMTLFGQVEVVEDVPEAVVHEDNDWGISLVDEDLGDAGKIERSVPCLSCQIVIKKKLPRILLISIVYTHWFQCGSGCIIANP